MPNRGYPRVTRLTGPLDTRERRVARGTASAGDVSNSITLTMPSIFVVSGSPAMLAGTFTVTLQTESQNTALLGPVTGAAATPTFRVLDPRDLALGADALVYAATISISTTNGKKLKTVTTTNAIGNSTFNAADGGVPDQEMRFIITNDATAPRTITFGTNFKPNGTLVGNTSKTSTIGFVSDGVNWWEQYRTVGVL